MGPVTFIEAENGLASVSYWQMEQFRNDANRTYGLALRFVDRSLGFGRLGIELAPILLRLFQKHVCKLFTLFCSKYYFNRPRV